LGGRDDGADGADDDDGADGADDGPGEVHQDNEVGHSHDGQIGREIAYGQHFAFESGRRQLPARSTRMPIEG